MVGAPLWRHIRNVLERSLPDAGFDQEYFHLLEQETEPDPGPAPAQQLDPFSSGSYGEPTPATGDGESGPSPAGYLHTIRGVSASCADVNRARHRYEPRSTSTTGDAHVPPENRLDLSGKAASTDARSPHILDIHS